MSDTKVRCALLSVSDKAGLVELASALVVNGVKLLSTGGSAKALRDAGLPVTDVAEYTQSPEVMDGRVKTLHPRVHGGILARNLESDIKELEMLGGEPIDLVIVNLYPFESTVAKGADYATCVENIDIGGPTMVRSAAKNHQRVSIVVDPKDYAMVAASLPAGPSYEERAKLAAKAFFHTAGYDSMICTWLGRESKSELLVPLKYGCNPQQLPACISGIGGDPLPFQVLNGKPGYINLLDAVNAWQLVKECRQALGVPAAASFKHVSPAGAAVYEPLSDILLETYEVKGKKLTPASIAYLRARQADPLCSFGDFAALSDPVDVETAEFLQSEVSDGIIAPGYSPEALKILSLKKKGSFIILLANSDYEPPLTERREIGGARFEQRRNDAVIDLSSVSKIVSKDTNLPAGAARDLVLAQLCIKYTQSNSVGYALNGQMIGVGAGQQSRVDCVKLAGRKAQTWALRQHPKVLGLPFKEGSKRQDRVNARVQYIEGDFAGPQYEEWKAQFTSEPAPLTAEEKVAFLKVALSDVALASDAFFPFRDNIDVASRFGVKYLVHPGGSVQDTQTTAAADEYGMVMAHSGVRLFHH
ncbi:cytidine deaminase-like protein [Pavlovales sp. CCMP2436]|nr:cytidine deaminase-like protein [Pavlovales sp. CCMP2436]|mmetsp:Transcript_10251/g.23773  ORF Transcript_10251/g.23773 Transcript_10251/m.23773 type:complete len:588 (-) Transcript_10251:296-2059(-)